MWSTKGLTNQDTPICNYKEDSRASQVYRDLSGCTGAIPLENNFNGDPNTPSDGSDCGHWDENCFGTELMTPSGGEISQFSSITIAGLEDLGYSVNYAAADPFTAEMIDARCRAPTCNAPALMATPEEPKLSPELYAAAVTYGKKEIASIMEGMPPTERSKSIPLHVLVYENDRVYGVIVYG